MSRPPTALAVGPHRYLPPAGAHLRKPGARAHRLSLFEREVRERLTSVALDLMLGRARVLSEGGRARALPRPDGSAGPDPFFGSTMLTIDLADLAADVREPADDAVAARVAALLTADPRAGRRVRQLAEREASRLAGGRVDTNGTEVRVRAVGATVHVDVDLEGMVRAGDASGRAADPAPATSRRR